MKWKQVKWLVCAGALVWSAALGCQRGDQAPELAWHGTVKIKSPITAVEQKCGGRRCAVQGHPSVDSIEYDANAAGDIKAVLVRYKLPKERSVKASRTLSMSRPATGSRRSWARARPTWRRVTRTTGPGETPGSAW